MCSVRHHPPGCAEADGRDRFLTAKSGHRSFGKAIDHSTPLFSCASSGSTFGLFAFAHQNGEGPSRIGLGGQLPCCNPSEKRMVRQPANPPGRDRSIPTQVTNMSYSTKSLVCASLAGLSMMATLPVAAQDQSGLYVSAYGGSSSLASTSLTESRTSLSTLTGKGSFGSGIGLGGAFGYRYGNGWAAELAWDYRSHDVKRIGGTPVQGDFASTTAFINGYYRFQKLGIVRPFVGAGLGYVTEIDMDLSRGGSEQEYSRRG
jgi:Outer membrane protein beta-barrel domain